MSSSHRIGIVVGLALLPGAPWAETLDVKTGTHASDGAHTMDSSATFSARWLSAECEKK